MDVPLFVLSIFPFLLFLLLFMFRKLKLLYVSLIVLMAVLLIQIFYWGLVPLAILNSVTKGFFVAFDIFLIILGAVFFLEILKKIKVIENISLYLESISKDYRVQVILLAWFLVNFLEGMAGFGTPGVIVAPLLVSLGLQPITAVIVSLLGNSSAGAFGAVGTPIRVGFAGLDITNVPLSTVLFNGVGILFPVFILWMLTKNQKDRKNHFFEMLPFALWSGMIFYISSLAVVGIGQEFVSIAGSLLGIVLIVLSIKLKIFTPKIERKLVNRSSNKMSLPLVKVVLPYITIFGLLVLGKMLLKSVNIVFPWGYSYSFNLFNPGIIFIIGGIPFAIMSKQKGLFGNSIKKAMTRTVDPFLVILSMSTMIQLMVNSGNNINEYPSVLSVLAGNINEVAFPLLVPFIGAMGTFITGSITVSNILFGNILATASNIYNLSLSKVLALEISGAAVGNSMAIADVMSAEAVVGLKNKTREVIRWTVGPCLIALSILGIVGLIVL